MKRNVIVFGCNRTGLASAPLPDGVQLVQLPCTGRVSLPLLLHCFVHPGTDGVLVLGRHQDTCRFRGAEDAVRHRVDRCRRLLDLAGLDANRLRFAEPPAGQSGPISTVEEFCARLKRPAAPRGDAPPLADSEGLDTSLALAHSLIGGSCVDTVWLDAYGLPAAAPDSPRLLLPIDLPLLTLLDEGLFRPTDLVDQVGAALAVMARLGFPGAGVELSGDPDEELRHRSINDLIRDQGDGLPRPSAPSVVACDGCSSAQVALLEALGYRPVDVGPDPLPARFTLSPALRSLAELRLERAEAQGASGLLVDDFRALARWSLLTRDGTWRSSRIRPLLGAGLAQLSMAGLPLGPAATAPTGSTRGVTWVEEREARP